MRHFNGVLAALGDGSVRSRASVSFDFDRDAMPAEGEAGTRRLQLRASFVIGVPETTAEIGGLTVSMSIIETTDGTSLVFSLGGIPGR